MPKLIFPPKTINQMEKAGVYENDIRDVYNSGSYEKTPKGSYRMWKKYENSKSEIGFLYMVDNFTGNYIVTYTWKRERR